MDKRSSNNQNHLIVHLLDLLHKKIKVGYVFHMGIFLKLTFEAVYIHDMTRSMFTNFALVVSLAVNVLRSNVTVECGVQGLMTSQLYEPPFWKYTKSIQ